MTEQKGKTARQVKNRLEFATKRQQELLEELERVNRNIRNHIVVYAQTYGEDPPAAWGAPVRLVEVPEATR